ncbi:MAG: zinc ribbon domain-containing protein [Candidatus Aminicenantes bacterium]|nr:zinc ribbon domain-containing protein [Candidatus Aminicenantes bacterium]
MTLAPEIYILFSSTKGKMTTQCPKCDSENPDTKQFCGDCGTQLIPSKGIPAQTITLVTPSQELSRGTTIAGRYEIIQPQILIQKQWRRCLRRLKLTKLQQELMLPWALLGEITGIGKEQKKNSKVQLN